jgi:glc operon protein GlcG
MELPSKKVLTLELAKRIAAVCTEYAHQNGHAIDLAIVDAGGYLVYFEREDGVSVGTVQVAILKAQSSAVFRRPSKDFETSVDEGLIGMVALPGMAPFEGAVPVTVDDDVIGAVAVSGVTKEIDGEIAQVGADAVAGILAG